MNIQTFQNWSSFCSDVEIFRDHFPDMEADAVALLSFNVRTRTSYGRNSIYQPFLRAYPLTRDERRAFPDRWKESDHKCEWLAAQRNTRTVIETDRKWSERAQEIERPMRNSRKRERERGREKEKTRAFSRKSQYRPLEGNHAKGSFSETIFSFFSALYFLMISKNKQIPRTENSAEKKFGSNHNNARPCSSIVTQNMKITISQPVSEPMLHYWITEIKKKSRCRVLRVEWCVMIQYPEILQWTHFLLPN